MFVVLKYRIINYFKERSWILCEVIKFYDSLKEGCCIV